MSAQENGDEPAEVDLADAVEDALEPEVRRALPPLPEPPGRGRPPREREDRILDELRDR